MKKNFGHLALIVFLILLTPFVYSQTTVPQDSVKKQKSARVVPENEQSTFDEPDRGYFQKVYTDKGEAHFTVEDKKRNFRFGIGGTLHFTGFFDFNGGVDANSFKMFSISVPTDYATHFGYTMGATKLHFRTVGKVGNKSVVAYIELGVPASSLTGVILRHAYFSYGGLTVGHTWSQFMDLAAGTRTVDLEGANTEISVRQPLIAYRLPLPEQWDVTFSAELPSFELKNSKNYGTEWQNIPDLIAHFKYKGKIGHIQLGGLFRTLRYIEYQKDSAGNNVDYTTKHQFGYGVALSGSIRPCKGLLFSGQFVAGRGIASYINDLSSAQINMIRIIDRREGQENKEYLSTVPNYGGYLSAQYTWANKNQEDKWAISVVYGYSRLLRMKGFDFNVEDCGNYSSSRYLATSLFWMVTQDFTLGIEYLYGKRYNRDWEDKLTSGHANRIDMMLTYSF